MKKIIIMLIFIICVPTLCAALTTDANLTSVINYTVNIGNDKYESGYPVYLSQNRIYLSLRSICEELNIPVYWDSVNKEATMDIYNKQVPVSERTEYKKEGVIPDEETAYTIGKVILEKYIGKPLEYETEDKVFYLDTRYIEEENAWQIFQTFRFKENNSIGSIDGWAEWISIKLNKNSGEVLYINTFGTFSE